jgi:hypothetical protein
MWEGMDEPLQEGNWPLVAASALPYKPFSQTPRALSRAQLTDIREQFTAAAARAARAGFDLLELHCAHGYLLSGFLSPLTNRRTDAYGGSAAKRLRFPLEVFDAVRNVWPGERPLTVRISATDWAEGGTTAEGAVEIARAFAAHGADAIDVSTGQVVAAGVRAVVPDAVRGPYPPCHRCPGDRGRRDLLLGRRQLPDPGGPHGSVRPGPPPPLRPALDPARGGRTGLHRAGRRLAGPVPGGQPPTPDGPHGRPEAAAEPVTSPVGRYV